MVLLFRTVLKREVGKIDTSWRDSSCSNAVLEFRPARAARSAPLQRYSLVLAAFFHRLEKKHVINATCLGDS